MRLRKLRLQNFRSFGEDTTIAFDDLTTLVGANSAGKTAVMHALTKLFGRDPKDRQLHRSDFHLPKDVDPRSVTTAELIIEAVFDFPELATDDQQDQTAEYTVPEIFNQLVIETEGAAPILRMRLTATWVRSNAPEGEIEDRLEYIKVSETEDDQESDRVKVKAHERSRIQVLYVPAVRDPSTHLKQHSGAILNRLFKAIKWTEALPGEVKNVADSLNHLFGDEPGIRTVSDLLAKHWTSFHDERRYSQVHLGFSSDDLEEMLTKVELRFRPTHVDRPYSVEELGDGLRSLFYLTLVSTVVELEATMQRLGAEAGLSSDQIVPPALTILAIEEPENHLAPHLLGRAVRNMVATSQHVNGQVIFSSHTPAILKRIDPKQVRHLRFDRARWTTIVNEIVLPVEDDEAHKFVKEAVRAYPELYFSRLVIFGEGDSEELIIPRLLGAHGVEPDSSEISVVPLGGRHINHFWNLLNQLSIPYVTLLDLDREREGGGWGRVQYVIQQLRKLGVPRSEFIHTKSASGRRPFTDKEFTELHTRLVGDTARMDKWIEHLRQHGIYFAYPLDLDFMMLSAFPTIYKECLGTGYGPRIPSKKSNATGYAEKVATAMKHTLKQNGTDGATYAAFDQELFIWYDYLFLGRSKPVTHLDALSRLSDEELLAQLPEPLQTLYEAAKAKLDAEQDQ